MTPFSLLYFGAALLLYIAALPWLILLTLKKKYRHSIPARFFLCNNPPFTTEGIWFHVCSLGESRALKPLLERLKHREIAITVTTQTGYEASQSYNAEVRYLPFEIFLPFWIRKQKTLVVLEAEFWYLLFAIASARGAKVVLLNARISERSYPKYLKLRWFYRKIFSYVDTVLVQSEIDQKRFSALGARHIEVVGNIKLAQKITATRHYKKSDIETIVAASTHEGEDGMILSEFAAYRKERKSRLLVVPRHPERFEKVWALMQRVCDTYQLTCKRFSLHHDFDADMVLVDAMGELNNIYAISDIAILGGAFAPIGGHNPLEPATFGCKIITGKHHFNQLELFKYVENIFVCELHELNKTLLAAEQLRAAYITETIDMDRIIDIIGKDHGK